MTVSARLALVASVLVASAAAGNARAVAATARCPASAPPAPKAGGASILVPPGAVSLLLCRYGGLNSKAPHRLLRARFVSTRKEIGGIVGSLDRLPKMRKVIMCPMDDGSEIVATFRYPSAAPVTIDIGLTGCRTITNGRLTRTAAGSAGQRLIATLTALVG